VAEHLSHAVLCGRCRWARGDIPERWRKRSVYALDVVEPLDDSLASRLAARFAGRVMDAAALPAARTSDIRESCEMRRDGHLLRLTCTITGRSHEREWDGSESAAVAVVDEAADDTAHLITSTPHYAWLRSAR
jgi:hypothetical protein